MGVPRYPRYPHFRPPCTYIRFGIVMKVTSGRAELGVPGVPRYPHLLGVLQNKNLKKNGNFAKKVFQYLPYLLGYPHLKFASALTVAHQAVLISYHDYAILEYSGELISRNIAILMTKGKFPFVSFRNVLSVIRCFYSFDKKDKKTTS